MTQDQLAWSAKTSQRNIVRWERGHTQPRAGVVARLAEATGHPVEFFYTETDGPDATDDDKMVADLMAALRAFVVSTNERTAA